MKIKTKAKPAPEPTHDEALEAVDVRLSRVAEEIALLDLRLSNLKTEAANELMRRIEPPLERYNRRMEEVEQHLIYQVRDFFEQCPFQEVLKLPREELNKSGASAVFNKKMKEGWRYLGDFYDTKKGVGGVDRYTLMYRPKGKPIAEQEYLEMYAEFVARQAAAAKVASTKPKNLPESSEEDEVEAVPILPAGKLKPATKPAKGKATVSVKKK